MQSGQTADWSARAGRYKIAMIRQPDIFLMLFITAYYFICRLILFNAGRDPNKGSVVTSGMAAGSVIVAMTSLMRSMGMSPTTRGLLFSSWGRGSEGLRFSPTTL